MKSSANTIIATQVLSSIRPTHANKQSNVSAAMMIFVDEVNSPTESGKSHRARCVARFESELKQKPATASTYYNICSTYYRETADQVSEQTISKNPPRIYTVYKTKPGTNTITQRIVTSVQRDAEAIKSGLTFSGVARGILQVGQEAPTVH